MAHDKIRAAARERMAKTGEPYTAARRAAVSQHQPSGVDSPPAGAGYLLAMSKEIHDWLGELRVGDESAALRVVRALVTLMTQGASTRAPLVISTAESWPWALSMALDRSCQQRLERAQAARWEEAGAAAQVKDIQEQVAALAVTQATLEDARRRALGASRPQEAAQAANKLAAIQQQAAKARQLLPGMIETRNRLCEQSRQFTASADAARIRKEVLKATHTAVLGRLRADQALRSLAASNDDGEMDLEATENAVGAAEAELADITARMERELGQHARPEGLMELWPGAPWHGDIRILFAVEPPGTALLIAVLEGLDVVEEQYPEAVMASADVLRQVRAGQAPEPGERTYDNPQAFVEEFYPGTTGGAARQ